MSEHIMDAAVRARALDPASSFCVQAPAGSGKTELLTQRILNLLAHCERPEEVLAFTFTRKAAAEMRKRLLDSLQLALVTDDSAVTTMAAHKRLTIELAKAVLARDELLNWKLLHNSQRLRINTIDSFTSWLSARLPLASGFGARPQISTDMDKVYAQAVRNTLEALNDSGPVAEQVASLLRHLHNDLGKAETLLLLLLKKRDQWLPLITRLGNDPAQARTELEHNLRILLEELFDDAVRRLVPYEQSIMSLLLFAGERLSLEGDSALLNLEFDAALPPASAEAGAQWQAVAKLFLLATGAGFRKKVDRRNGFPPKSSTKDKEEAALFASMHELFTNTVADLQQARLLPLLQRLAGIPPAEYGDRQWDVLADVVNLLPLLAAHLHKAMSHAGVVDHTQTSLAALAALGTEFEPTDLALQLDYRIRHILIDEFQDTSSMQYSLLKQLTAGWADGDGRTLFIVGDGMQSCYSFRNANVTLFLRAREQVEHVKMELLLLQVNFRSTASVVSWVNAVFSGAFPQENDLIRGGVSYSHSAASDPASSSAGVSCRLFVQPDENFDRQAQRRHEAEAVARLCLELQQQHPGERIAILVRNRGNLADIVPALRRTGLSWNAEEIDPLLSYPAVNDLFTLLRALLDPADVTAGLALLRCPFIGIGLQDLELLAQQRTGQNCTLFETLSAWDAVPALSDAARTRLQRSVPHLQTALTLRQTLPLAELLENLWLELGGPACNEDNSVLDNIATFFRLVHTHSEAGDIPDLQHFEIQLQRCYGSARDSTVQLQIMTIHKAKGLEFEHVILPGLERQGRSNSSELLYWQEYIDQQQITRPLLGLMTSKGDEADLLYRYLRKEAGLREKLETGRLLYIAATRAIKSAWLFGCVKKNKMGYSAPANSLLHTILEQLQAERETLQVQFEDLVAGIQGSGTSMLLPVTQPFRRLPLSWQNPLQGRTLPPLQAVTSDSIDTVTHDVLAAAVGELVHLGLQQLVLQGPDWLHTKRFSALCARKLRPLCASFQELQQASLKVHNQLHNCLAAPEAQWLFHTRHQDDACELALTDYRGRYRKDYTIDRTFIDAEGVRWIIDYKSSTPAAGQSREVFLQEHTTRYRSQLETYASLLQQPGAAVPVKLALYFTALPTLHFLQKS